MYWFRLGNLTCGPGGKNNSTTEFKLRVIINYKMYLLSNKLEYADHHFFRKLLIRLEHNGKRFLDRTLGTKTNRLSPK